MSTKPKKLLLAATGLLALACGQMIRIHTAPRYQEAPDSYVEAGSQQEAPTVQEEGGDQGRGDEALKPDPAPPPPPPRPTTNTNKVDEPESVDTSSPETQDKLPGGAPDSASKVRDELDFSQARLLDPRRRELRDELLQARLQRRAIQEKITKLTKQIGEYKEQGDESTADPQPEAFGEVQPLPETSEEARKREQELKGLELELEALERNLADLEKEKNRIQTDADGRTAFGPYPQEFLVVTLPDPLDSNLTREFDLLLDALRKAFEYNDFVIDRFYLPWYQNQNASNSDAKEFVKLLKTAFATGPDTTPTSSSDAQDKPGGSCIATRASGRPHQDEPGIILFRKDAVKSTHNAESKSHDESKNHGESELVGVLLVGEAPTWGIQKNALLTALDTVVRETKNTGNPQKINLIGPVYSGSAASLRLTLLEWLKSPCSPRDIDIQITSGTATRELNREIIEDIPSFKDRAINVKYTTLATEDKIKQDVLFHQLKERFGISRTEIALLVESSAFGSAYHEQSSDPSNDVSKDDEVLILPFPMHISQTRTDRARWEAEQKTNNNKTAKLPRKFLELDLSGPSEFLSAPRPFAPLLTARTAEMTLARIISEISLLRKKAVGIIATDVRDQLFLAKIVRQYFPDAYLFSYEGDELLAHPDYSGPCRGMILASSNNLKEEREIRTDKATSRKLTLFPNDRTHGLFRAVLASLDPTAAGMTGQVWIHTVGRGDLWRIAATRMGILSVAVDPGAPRRIYVGTYQEGVLKSEDRGRHWEPLAGTKDRWIPNRVEALAVQGKLLYAGTPEGLFRWGAEEGWDEVDRTRPVTALISDQHNSRLLLGSNDGIYAYDRTGQRKVYIEEDGRSKWCVKRACDERVLSLAVIDATHVVVGSYHGASVVAEGHDAPTAIISNGIVRALAYSPETERIFAGTGTGLKSIKLGSEQPSSDLDSPREISALGISGVAGKAVTLLAASESANGLYEGAPKSSGTDFKWNALDWDVSPSTLTNKPLRNEQAWFVVMLTAGALLLFYSLTTLDACTRFLHSWAKDKLNIPQSSSDASSSKPQSLDTTNEFLVPVTFAGLCLVLSTPYFVMSNHSRQGTRLSSSNLIDTVPRDIAWMVIYGLAAILALILCAFLVNQAEELTRRWKDSAVRGKFTPLWRSFADTFLLVSGVLIAFAIAASPFIISLNWIERLQSFGYMFTLRTSAVLSGVSPIIPLAFLSLILLVWAVARQHRRDWRDRIGEAHCKPAREGGGTVTTASQKTASQKYDSNPSPERVFWMLLGSGYWRMKIGPALFVAPALFMVAVFAPLLNASNMHLEELDWTIFIKVLRGFEKPPLDEIASCLFVFGVVYLVRWWMRVLAGWVELRRWLQSMYQVLAKLLERAADSEHRTSPIWVDHGSCGKSVIEKFNDRMKLIKSTEGANKQRLLEEISSNTETISRTALNLIRRDLIHATCSGLLLLAALVAYPYQPNLFLISWITTLVGLVAVSSVVIIPMMDRDPVLSRLFTPSADKLTFTGGLAGGFVSFFIVPAFAVAVGQYPGLQEMLLSWLNSILRVLSF